MSLRYRFRLPLLLLDTLLLLASPAAATCSCCSCSKQDEAPLRLPSITTRKRVVLVRHGQSTWNAEGRIQGSSDFSELTPKGMAQAETTRDMVRWGF